MAPSHFPIQCWISVHVNPNHKNKLLKQESNLRWKSQNPIDDISTSVYFSAHRISYMGKGFSWKVSVIKKLFASVLTGAILLWCHNKHDGISNHQPHKCLLNRLFRRRSKKTSNHRITGLCVRNSPVTCEFPAQMASNAENVSIWWCHHEGM